MLPDPTSPPPLSFRRLALVGTGSLGVAFLPFWLNWLRGTHPDLEVRVILTRSACRFVAPDAVSAILGREVELDDWDGGVGHVELAEWCDAVAVHPATVHFIARYAQGLADTPLLLALQCTPAPVALAPSLPPGALEHSPTLREHLALLRRRGVAVAAPQRGRSAAGSGAADVAAPLMTLLPMLEERLGSDETNGAADQNGAADARTADTDAAEGHAVGTDDRSAAPLPVPDRS